MTMETANIISASRRTDIPAFYSQWFLNRIRAGFVEVINPFNAKQISRISMKPEDVAAIVFWTRHAGPLMSELDGLRSAGYHFYFNYTLNNYPRELEERVPATEVAIKTMHTLAGLISPNRVHWRYDPVIISAMTPFEWHLKNFLYLAAKLENATRRCYFSFVDNYKKTKRNLHRHQPDFKLQEPKLSAQRQFIREIAASARKHGITLFACCEDDLLQVDGVEKARCIDSEFLQEVFPEIKGSFPKKPTRNQCGCSVSRDIGAYDSCIFRCIYCYANTNFAVRSAKRHAAHDPLAPCLIP